MDTLIDIECNRCHSKFVLAANEQDIKDWQGGKFIQQAMPYLSPDERELLISRTCGKCFDELFPEED